MPLTYKQSGVDVGLADKLVEHLRKRSPVIGGFSGLHPFRLGSREIFLAASTDGVGTKLKLAFLLDKHDTVGVDLVAMCVNDLVTCGATPLFFLDYYATAKLDLKRSKKLLDGVLEGCRLGRMTLLGGETAEMPGFYKEKEYDLAGFAVGWVEKNDVLDGRSAREGDLLAALPSSGLHSNGFSLVRKAFSDAKLKRQPDLLTPTRIYVDEARTLRAALGGRLKAMAHITGEGLEGNVPRVLPKGLRAVVERGRWDVPEIFRRVQHAGKVPEADMWSTFNMGTGLVAVISPEALTRAKRAAPDLFVIGRIEKGRTGFAFEGDSRG